MEDYTDEHRKLRRELKDFYDQRLDYWAESFNKDIEEIHSLVKSVIQRVENIEKHIGKQKEPC